MRSLKEALIKKHTIYKKSSRFEFEQFDIVRTRSNMFWCFLKDPKYIKMVLPNNDISKLEDGIIANIDRPNLHYSSFMNLKSYDDDLKSIGPCHSPIYDIVGVWRSNKSMANIDIDLEEYLLENNLRQLATGGSWQGYNKYIKVYEE